MRLPRVHPADGLLLTLLAAPLRHALRAADTFLANHPRRHP